MKDESKCTSKWKDGQVDDIMTESKQEDRWTWVTNNTEIDESIEWFKDLRTTI